MNWNIFFELLLGGLDEKITSAGCRRKRNKKKKAGQYEEPVIYSNFGLCHVQVINSIFLDKFIAFEASKWSQITFCILTNILNSISERFGPNFEQIDISLTTTSITVACILIDKALPLVFNRQSSLWARILLLLTLIHSLRRTAK